MLRESLSAVNRLPLSTLVGAVQEGGGIFRHVWLETSGKVSIVPWGLYAPSLVNGSIAGANASAAQTTDSAIFLPRLDLQNADSAATEVTVRFTLTSESTGAAQKPPRAIQTASPFSRP